MSNPELKKVADSITASVLREYRMSTRNSPLTYVKLARKIHASGLSKARALEIVNTSFPNEAKAFVEAQNSGQKMPVIFQREGESYEVRRARAMARGGII